MPTANIGGDLSERWSQTNKADQPVLADLSDSDQSPPSGASDGGGSPPGAERERRRAALAVLAQAHRDEIEQGLRAATVPVEFVELRAPECGLIMLRGRIGGDGAP